MYDEYYGLKGRPFQLTPDPRFYFESLTHRKALSYLGYGLAQGEGFIVITGEVGAGKTTLVRHLMATIDRQRLTAATIVTTQLEGRDLLGFTASAFGIEDVPGDKAQLLDRIEKFLHAEARAGRRCLLIVDEAQNLPIDSLEELRMLSNFQLGGQALLQIFLLGQPEFRETLRHNPKVEQLRQRIIASHHLEAMEPQEIEPYVLHRLSKVGWNGRPRFTSEALAKLHTASGGIPRRLNILMSRVMLMGAVEQIEIIDGKLVDAMLADLDEKQIDDEASHASNMDIPDPRQAESAAGGEAPPPAATPAATPADAAVTAPEHADESGYASTNSATEALRRSLQSRAAASTPAQGGGNAPSSPAQAGGGDGAALAKAEERIAALEARLKEQEDTLKRVIGMLVEWIEGGGPDNADAARKALDRDRAA